MQPSGTAAAVICPRLQRGHVVGFGVGGLAGRELEVGVAQGAEALPELGFRARRPLGFDGGGVAVEEVQL